MGGEKLRRVGVGSGSLSLLLFGTAGTLLSKVLYALQAPDRHGEMKLFRKPWASTFGMFIGMMLCLALPPLAAALRPLLSHFKQRTPPARNTRTPLSQPLLGSDAASSDSRDSSDSEGVQGSSGPPQGGRHRGAPPHGAAEGSLAAHTGQSRPPVRVPGNTNPAAGGGGEGPEGERAGGVDSGAGRRAAAAGLEGGTPMKGPSASRYALILIPTAFDLAATALMSVGLLYVTVSVYQMMRGTEIIFSALLSTAFLRRDLNRQHVVGIMLCTVGICVVGAAGVLGGQGDAAAVVSSREIAIGMVLVVAAEAVQAAQIVVEDHFMTALGFEPLTMVGYEGLYGTLLLGFVLLPLLQYTPGVEGAGLHEDSLETLGMLRQSGQLAGALALFVVIISVYNIAGMTVTEELGAVTRTVLETLRTLLVWLLDLLLYYGAPLGGGSKLGEPWTNFSWLQAVGFVLLVGGTLVYGEGEEVQEGQLKKEAQRRARARWRKVRRALPQLTEAVAAQEGEYLPEELAPMRPPRIAGPARIRTAFLPVLFLHRMEGLSRPRWGALHPSTRSTALHQGGETRFDFAAISRRSSLDQLHAQQQAHPQPQPTLSQHAQHRQIAGGRPPLHPTPTSQADVEQEGEGQGDDMERGVRGGREET